MLIGVNSGLPRLSARPAVASGAGLDRFTPQEPGRVDLSALVRRLTTVTSLPPVLSTQKASHTNLIGRAWLDDQGIAHLPQAEKVARMGPGGEALEEIALPRTANFRGVMPGPNGVLAYVSTDGHAMALRNGRVEMDVALGAGPQARIVPLPRGEFLVGEGNALHRLSARGESLSLVSLGERQVADFVEAPDGGVFVRTQDGRVSSYGPGGEERWTTDEPLRNFGLNSSLQLSRDGQTLFVNGAHKALVGLDPATGEQSFSLPLGKEDGYWAATPWLELENGERWILTEGGRILRVDPEGASRDPIATGAQWGQINGARPSLQRSGELVAVMPSVSTVQIFSLDGVRRASYACRDQFRAVDYFHSADFHGDQLLVTAGSFQVARLKVEDRAPEGVPGEPQLRETPQAVVVGGIQLRKRSALD